VRYSGAWRAGTGGHYLWVNADWNNFVAKWRELAPQGLRLTVIDSHIINGQRRYAGVWRPGTDGYYLWGNARWQNFVAKWRELADRNLRLIHLDVIDAPSVPTRPWVRVHFKTLTQPTIPAATMLARMREVYNASGIDVELGSTETLNLPALNDLDVGACTMGSTTAEQNQLYGNRNSVNANDVAVYFVRSTVPPFNGCAAFPAGQPSCCVVQGATQWTMAHEVGHVLGLSHVNNNDQLMTGNGTGNITNPPPDLVAGEVTTMLNSAFTQDW
jgi:Polyglycine hydrolase-like, structural repeat